MALRAGYYGLKRRFKDKLESIAGSYDRDRLDIWSDIGLVGAKNLLLMTAADIKTYNTSGTWDGNVYTYRGVIYTLTVNDAGYVTQISTSGTATGGTSYLVLRYDLLFKSGFTFTLSGCGKYGVEVWIGLYDTATGQYVDAKSINGVDGSFGYDADTTRQLRIRIGNGTVATDFVFKPMMRYATDPDTTFQPYAMTNQELTASAADQKTTINAIISAATGAADFAAFKAAMEAITPVTRSLSIAAAPEEIVKDEIEEPVVEKKTTRKKSTAKAETQEEV